MSAHTPGPWDYSEEDGYVFSDADVEGNIVCNPPMLPASMEYWPANARLIAAGPDLLKALTEQAEFLQSLHTTYRHDSRLAARIELHLSVVRAVIAKAIGAA
jgi:hypothetical protein